MLRQSTDTRQISEAQQYFYLFLGKKTKAIADSAVAMISLKTQQLYKN